MVYLKCIAFVFVCFSLLSAESDSVDTMDTLSAPVAISTLDSLFLFTGARAMIAGNYNEAEEYIRKASYADSGYYYLSLGELARRRGNESLARWHFLRAVEASETVAPFAYRCLGDMELDNHHLSYAVLAYRNAAEITENLPYQDYLYHKIDSLSRVHSDTLYGLGWVALRGASVPKVKQNVDSTIQIYRKTIKEQGLTDAVFQDLLADAAEKRMVKSLYRILRDTSLIVSPFPTEEIFEIARAFSRYGYYRDASDWLHRALQCEDFSEKVSEKEYLRFRSQLNFSLKNWDSSIRWAKAYIKKYGDRSDLVYQTARAYRSLGKRSEAQDWYFRHVQKYPTTATSHKVLWYLAWEEEDNKRYDSAITLFHRLAYQKPRGRHSDEAGLRIGLLEFRQERYAAARDSLRNYRRRLPSSGMVPGTYYWEARSLLALKDTASAEALLDSLSEQYPLHYYAFRGRELTGEMRIPPGLLAGITDEEWRCRLADVAQLEEPDSLLIVDPRELFSSGVILGALGLHDEAEIILEPLEFRNSKNYPLIADLSAFYSEIGLSYRSYRLVRKMYWALPSSQRSEFSPEYLSLFYPVVYPSDIPRATTEFGVEEALVRAVMRQESMFSPTIVSPVGAAGLMQIMPYTGKEIATDLDTSFQQSMLFVPDVNIRFGTYYLSKVLKQWNGDYIRAIASYNGGPHNVKKWVRNNADVLDDEAFFVECIGFAETRDYVRKVLENYWIYKARHEIVTSSEHDIVEKE